MGAISKAFTIIDAVSKAGNDGLTFSAVVESTNIPRASAHRMLKELVDISALSLDPVARVYRGGLLLARIGSVVSSNFELSKVARPYLQALHEQFGDVATLGTRSDDTGIYIDKVEAKNFGIRLHSAVGKTFPLHCTAMGKVLLSHSDPAVVRRLSKRKLERFTANTITDGKALRREIRHVRERGYAVDDEEITRGLVCVAAPIFGVDDDIVGAMSCTFPSYISAEAGLQSRIDAVRREAARVSALDELKTLRPGPGGPGN